MHGRIRTNETDLQSLTSTVNTLSSQLMMFAVLPPFQVLTSVSFGGTTTNWVSGSNLAVDGFGSWQPAAVCIHTYMDENGDPLYKCQLRGQIRSILASGEISTRLLTIPTALRPLKSQYHICRARTGIDTIASIQIDSCNGFVNVNDKNPNVERFVHLEGIEWTTH